MRQFDLVSLAALARKGSQRLHHEREPFEKRGKRLGKANTAVTRDLAGWRWSVASPLQEKAAPSLTGKGLR